MNIEGQSPAIIFNMPIQHLLMKNYRLVNFFNKLHLIYLYNITFIFFAIYVFFYLKDYLFYRTIKVFLVFVLYLSFLTYWLTVDTFVTINNFYHNCAIWYWLIGWFLKHASDMEHLLNVSIIEIIWHSLPLNTHFVYY